MAISRVLVDLLGFTGSRGGTETYARELLTRLPALLPDIRFAALTGRAGADPVRAFFPGNVRVVPWVGPDPATWALGTVLATDLIARRNDADLVWAPANFGPVLRGVPRVVTIHDAIYDEVAGDVAERVQRSGTSLLMRGSARTADRLLTVSHAAAASVERYLGVPAERIDVIHNGSGQPRPVPDPWAVLERLGVRRGRPVVLSTGSRMPHKNFVGLIAALATLPPERRPLTIVAGSGLPDPLAREVARRGLRRDVVLPGWVDDAQLEALYQVADLYVCPSLAEGFGLPVVDALRRSVPVLANDIAVLREVGADYACFADATDAAAFGAAIADVVAAPRDPGRREAGRVWASGFTWEESARATASVLHTAVDASRRRQAS